jgi:beta-1,4-mannosyltransferase
VLIHTLILIWLFFFYLKTPEVIIVQNPPSIPVLSFLWLLKLFKRKTKVIIDVHNYGYTLMFKTKSKKMLDFCRWYEQYFIRKVADVALTVSEEMKKDIMKNWGVKKVDWSADPGCRLL